MKNERLLQTFLLLFFLLILASSTAFAQSEYVLPYPSAMPGSASYKLHLFLEVIEKYWYFGNFGQFKYNLKESDKYLVEAKTLFEYKQYFLGTQSLLKSDTYFKNIGQYLYKAKKEGKDVVDEEKILKEASQKHIEVLETLAKSLPESFLWEPERGNKTQLYLNKLIQESILLRNTN